jgi:mono/diheme cytochrome c family protein
LLVATWATTAALGCSSAPAPDPAAIARGETLFHDRVLEGLGATGRACSDCHMDADSFQLSPANVETRFQQMSASGIDDPLFRPIDAAEPALDALETQGKAIFNRACATCHGDRPNAPAARAALVAYLMKP